MISLLLSGMIVGLTLYATAPVTNSHPMDSVFRQNVEANIDFYEANIAAHLNHPLAWLNTVASASNGNLQRCLTDAAFNCPGVTSNLTVFDAMGTVVIDSTNPLIGFEAFGLPCANFGTGNCIFQYRLTWRPLCPGFGPCVLPMIQINLNFTSGAPLNSKLHFNPSRFNYTVGIN